MKHNVAKDSRYKTLFLLTHCNLFIINHINLFRLLQPERDPICDGLVRDTARLDELEAGGTEGVAVSRLRTPPAPSLFKVFHGCKSLFLKICPSLKIFRAGKIAPESGYSSGATLQVSAQ